MVNRTSGYSSVGKSNRLITDLSQVQLLLSRQLETLANRSESYPLGVGNIPKTGNAPVGCSLVTGFGWRYVINATARGLPAASQCAVASPA